MERESLDEKVVYFFGAGKGFWSFARSIGRGFRFGDCAHMSAKCL